MSLAKAARTIHNCCSIILSKKIFFNLKVISRNIQSMFSFFFFYQNELQN